MIDPVYLCPEHGYLGDDVCNCDDIRVIVDSDDRVRLPKFLSGALRHFPGDVGLTLDDAGWTLYEEVVDTAFSRYDRVRPEHVDAVVSADPKGRFERNGERIRAAYGHSVDVGLDGNEDEAPHDAPETLYHGTARRNVDSIRQDVLQGRNEVYLSETVEQARQVGERHGDSAVFEVEASSLEVIRRGNGVHAVKRVPPEAVSLL